MKYLQPIFLLPLLFACQSNDTGRNKSIDAGGFRIPTVLDRQRSVSHLDSADLYAEAAPVYLGKSPFISELTLCNNELLNREQGGYSSYYQEFASDTSYKPQLILVPDYETTLALANLPENWPNEARYPVYLVNMGDDTALFSGNENLVFAVQERQTENGDWVAMEAKVKPTCGNYLWERKLSPKEFAVFAVRKYAGSEKAKLRVRLTIRKRELFSREFIGYQRL